MNNKNESENLLIEVAWEVCNQIGGIYTVIRSKVPSIIQNWGDNYCLVGPYFRMPAEFEPTDNFDDSIGRAVLKMREMGFEVHYGYWLVTGRPKVVLINPYSIYTRLGEIKYLIW
ncbi:MAG: glycogen synthase, partial [Cytophagales bacterium]|nr:glycogen synthase [Cytophagales bacterium]